MFGIIARSFSRFANGTPPPELDKKYQTGGFRSFGHFARAVARANAESKKTHPNRDPWACKAIDAWDDLQRKAPSGMFENSDPDGGVIVPVGYSAAIYERCINQNQLFSYLNGIPTRNKQILLPCVVENSRIDGSRWGGLTSYWRVEAAQYTRTRPTYRNLTLELKKLTVETVATNELLEDTDALESHLTTVASKEINFCINRVVINGTGAGVPRGILQSGGKITVAAVGGQGNGTIVGQNILDMFSRVVPSQRSSLIWLYNQDAEASLFRAYVPTGQWSGNALITHDNNGGLQIMGRPALVMEQCPSLGTEGDLIAFATDGYALAYKRAIESYMSIHVNFDMDESVFKWHIRMDGEPYDNTPLTPFNGSNTTSSVVTLSSNRT